MAFQDAPTVNGTMELTDAQKTDIKKKIDAIQAAFEPTIDQPVCDTFYLVATYNKDNELKINGDTLQAVLAEDDAAQ